MINLWSTFNQVETLSGYFFSFDNLTVTPMDYLIREKVLSCLLQVNLTRNQLIGVVGIETDNDERLQTIVNSLFFNQEDNLLQDIFVSCYTSEEEQVRIGMMRVMAEFIKNDRLTLFIQKQIEVLHKNTNLTEYEVFFLNAVLDKNSESLPYDVLLNIEKVDGVENLFILLSGLGENNFGHYENYGNYEYCSETLPARLRRKIKNCYPVPEDTKELFKELVKKNKICEQLLIELSFVAPQWRHFVGFTIGNNYFVEGVEFLLTMGGRIEVSNQTTLTRYEIDLGVVDINWFTRIYPELGEQMWNNLSNAARYSSTPREYARIKLFSDALSGKYTVEEIKKMYEEKEIKNHPYARDYMMALGIIPLKPEPDRMKDIVYRFQY